MLFPSPFQAAKVYTPKDGYLWQMAKAQVDACDNFLSQIHEHLLLAHFRMEPLCLALERHLSAKHPLHEILKYHCRGIFAGNSGIATKLINDGGHLNLLFGWGNRGALQVVRRGYKKMLWDDINLENSLKVCKDRRGFQRRRR